MRGGYAFIFAGVELLALPSGALWWPGERLLAVSDLHFGKSERLARRGGPLLPPYEVTETLARLDSDIKACDPARVVCVGDTFDDVQVALNDSDLDWLTQLTRERAWIWITGNHDPAPSRFGGAPVDELKLPPLTFRHIATSDGTAEISGHYHPKLRIAGQSRRCFLVGQNRLILPAYGTYTGGLASTDTALAHLMAGMRLAIIAGATCHPVPLGRPGGKG